VASASGRGRFVTPFVTSSLGSLDRRFGCYLREMVSDPGVRNVLLFDKAPIFDEYPYDYSVMMYL
jgi:hypothetical protein